MFRTPIIEMRFVKLYIEDYCNIMNSNLMCGTLYIDFYVMSCAVMADKSWFL